MLDVIVFRFDLLHYRTSTRPTGRRLFVTIESNKAFTQPKKKPIPRICPLTRTPHYAAAAITINNSHP
jgi:hypothetical protein